MKREKKYNKKKHRQLVQRIMRECPDFTIMLNVDDDWYPNYPNNQVKLSVFPLGLHDPRNFGNQELEIRVWVAGMDDCAMEQDHKVTGFDEFKAKYDELVNTYKTLNGVYNQTFFVCLGFVRA